MKLLIIFSILISINAHALKTRKCNRKQQFYLFKAYKYALLRGIEIENQVRNLPLDSYDQITANKIRKSLKVIACTNKKLKDPIFVCNDRTVKGLARITSPILGHTHWHKNLANAAGITIPGIGRSAWITNDFFSQFENVPEMATMLFHEMTHKCWTNDRVYYHAYNINPGDDSYSNWHRTAGFYDWWFIRGVCIPGYNCKDS